MATEEETQTLDVQPVPISSELYDETYYQTLNRGFAQYQQGVLHPKLKHAASLVGESRARILDVGCGRGELVAHLAFAGHEVVGVDYSPAALKLAEEFAKTLPEEARKKLWFLASDAKSLELESNTFDYVFMLDLIEHLHPWELEAALDEAYRVLKSGGHLILHTSPNKWLMGPARTVGRLCGIKTKSETYHINEQSSFSIVRYLSGFRSNIQLERDHSFWSWQVTETHRLRGLLKAVDRFFDAPFLSKLFDSPPLNRVFATDIWVLATKDQGGSRLELPSSSRGKLRLMLSKVGDLNFRRRIVRILSGLNIQPGERVLDAGCGEGFYTMLLHELYNADLPRGEALRGIEIHGLDFDASLINQAKEWLGETKRATLVVGDVKELPYPGNHFDKIICSEVIEHIVEDETVASELFRVLKPGGRLAVTVPNANYPLLWDPFNYLREKVFRLGHFDGKKGFFGGIWSYDHQRLYTPHQIQELLLGFGFKDLDLRALTHFGVPFNHLVLYIGKQFYTKLPVPDSIRKEMEKFEWQADQKPEARSQKLGLNPFKLALRLLELADSLNESRHDEHDHQTTAMASYVLVEKPDGKQSA